MPLDTMTVEALIRRGETLTVEFKGEERDRLPDRDIYEAVVAFANTDGGVLLLGVEDDARVTGARRGETDPVQMQAAVFNNTSPHINVRVSLHSIGGRPVFAVETDKYPAICATRKGVCVRRVIGADGKPENIPFLPHEHAGRQSALGLLDYSAQACQAASFADLDPLEFERLRQTVRRLNGDSVLLELDDAEIAKTLRLVDTRDGAPTPNVAGMLLLGREECLREMIPTHQAAFQVFDAVQDVRVNAFFQKPLLAVIEEMQQRFDARVSEEEILVGLFRLPVPEYGRVAFREALLNALLHRDYSRMEVAYVQWHADHLLFTSPGGLPEGVTIGNILVHEPKPRNARLYEAAKRIGLVEQSGRGVDKIFREQLRLGRPAPDYGRSDATAVRVVLHGGAANLDFARFVCEEDRDHRPLLLDDLMVLNQLHLERRIDTESAAALIQKTDSEARSVLARLVERGLVEALGEKKGRVYHLSGALYARLGGARAYVRARGIDPIRHESMILQFAEAKGRIRREEVVQLCGVSPGQASRLLQKLAAKGALEMRGARRGAHYVPTK